MNDLPRFVRGRLESRKDRPWNIRCTLCGHTWMTDGSGGEDINCAMCEQIAAEKSADSMLPMSQRLMCQILGVSE